MSRQIDELIQEQKKVEKQIDKVQNDSTITDIKIEPNIYLKGMFNMFVKEHSVLSIYIEGKEYFYPLESYQCQHLPISGSRVLIFNSEDDKHIIYGFNISKIIDPIEKVEAEVKAVLINQKTIKLLIKDLGYINVAVSNKFFENINLKLGEHILLNKLYIDGDYYFTISEELDGESNRHNILKILLRESK